MLVSEEQLQRICGGFLACLDAFQNTVPKTFADSCLLEILRSLLGYVTYRFGHQTYMVRGTHGAIKSLHVLESIFAFEV